MSALDELLDFRLEKNGRHRKLSGLIEYGPRFISLEDRSGKKILNFSSNDYLGLSRQNTDAGVCVFSQQPESHSQPSSRLLCGDLALHQAVEKELAKWLGFEACLLYPAGYMANLGLVSAIAERGDLVLMDRLCHASLIDGARLSWARLQRHRHLDLEDLDRRLRTLERGKTAWVITESVFSMDGDSPDFAGLAELKKRHGFFLIVDEAHAVGVHGPEGRGLLAEPGLAGLADAVTFTLSKAFALQGGVVAGSARLMEFLVNRSRPLIFTTAMPAMLVEQIPARLKALREADAEREALAFLCKLLDKELSFGRKGLSPIFPVILGSAVRAIEVAAVLKAQGMYCPAILPPTVPENTARLRVSLNAEHKEEDVKKLSSALGEVVEVVPSSKGKS